jgi:hypothetical protein
VSNTEAAESTVGKLKALGVDAIAIKANVGNADAAKIIVSGVLEGFQTSKIDILGIVSPYPFTVGGIVSLWPSKQCRHPGIREFRHFNCRTI